ncbi:MAG: hypothetical protein BWY12_01176 [candidate division BRC1 bacterium ADurb.Bin183]|nr:MAG: hypothetical protein BWY12_01176 [candidate division BRC1 bacterium ADurb.Bin183]
MPEIRTREVLQSVLLQTLARTKAGMQIHSAYDEVESNYTFPQEWYREIPASTGYDELERKGLDWRKVPQEKLVELVPTEPQWQNELRWARNDLRKAGYLDTAAPRGVWRLTPKGMSAAGNPSQHLTVEERRIATPVTPKPASKTKTAAPAGMSHRESLQTKLATLTSSMSLPDLQLLVDIARSIRLRAVEQ